YTRTRYITGAEVRQQWHSFCRKRRWPKKRRRPLTKSRLRPLKRRPLKRLRVRPLAKFGHPPPS
ncbi:MAG: hypothetical protein AAGC54_05290, partial [Cyanobacteria bacterium P01_F01_bin.4]